MLTSKVKPLEDHHGAIVKVKNLFFSYAQDYVQVAKIFILSIMSNRQLKKDMKLLLLIIVVGMALKSLFLFYIIWIVGKICSNLCRLFIISIVNNKVVKLLLLDIQWVEIFWLIYWDMKEINLF